MNNLPKRIPLSLGGCPGWSLQKAEDATTVFVRCMDDEEAERISEAAGFCRRHALSSIYRLFFSSYSIWQQILADTASPDVTDLFPIADELIAALVGWLLIWRLIEDQVDYDISRRFGKQSERLARIRQSRRDAYDAHQGYRLVEAIRNAVQHRELPSPRSAPA